MEEKIMHLLITEDDMALAQGLQRALQEKNRQVLCCKNIQETRQHLHQNQTDLLILDVNLPDGSGFDLLQEIRRTSDLPVILLTANDLEMDIVSGLEQGANDYITKPFNILEVKARMKAIMRRVAKKDGMSASGKVVVKGDLKIDCESRRVFSGDRELNLTAKEFDLLELLVKNENKVYSRENLLGLVWGKDYPGDVRTVDVHVRRLREKIETNPSEPKYVHTKWGVGYYYYQK